MKKLLIVLMVVAVSSFLFVGCLGDGVGVTPPVDDADDADDADDVLASATPVLTAVETSAEVSIFSVTSTSTLYMNKAEAGSSIRVKGTAPSESLVTIYIDDVAVTGAVGETLVTGLWTVAIAESSLGDDGVKVLTAKVTEVGLAESAASNSVEFTLDTDLPGISSIAATADKDAVTGGADGTITSAIVTGANPLENIVASSTDIEMVADTYTVSVWGNSAEANNVTIVSSSGTQTYTVTNTPTFIDVIPGVTFTFITLASGNSATITTTAEVTTTVAAIAGRATITFDEDVTHTAMAAGTYGGGVSADPYYYKTATDTGYWTDLSLTKDATLTITVYDISDLAGNPGGTSSSKLTATCTVGTASATSLAP